MTLDNLDRTRMKHDERFYGSNGHFNRRTQKSALIDYVVSTGDPECNFDFNTIKILDNCDVDYRLRIIESIYLKFGKQSLNTQEYSFPFKLF